MASIFKGPTRVTGNTWPYRDLLRSVGGRWSAEEKAWHLPPLSMRDRSRLGPLRGCNVGRR